MKITCTEIEREQLCHGATLCSFISRNDHCNEKDGCYKCKEKNIEWEITDKPKKQFSKEDIAKAMILCSEDDGCMNECPLSEYGRKYDCIELRNKMAVEYLTEGETNEPLTLYDLIDMMNEKKPVYIAGYGWFFIEKIVCDLNSTRIVTHTQNNFVYTKDSDRFYAKEVK